MSGRTLQELSAEAVAAFRAGRPDRAEALYRQIVAGRAAPGEAPLMANAHYNLAFLLGARGKPAEAEPHYRQAAALKPDNAKAHNNLGAVLSALGRPAEAEASCRRALGLESDYAKAHYNLANALKVQSKLDEAARHYRRALELAPDDADAVIDLATVLSELGETDEAVTHYRRALKLRPGDAAAHNDLGLVLADRGQWDEALALYARAIALQPDYADAHWNEALARLTRGEFQAGWAKYEWRLKLKAFPPRDFGAPRWTGGPLAGKTVLLHAEQGFGDTIQFLRYAPMVKAMGASVIVECQGELMRLFKTAPGVDRLVARGQALPDFDCHAPLPSLPGLFRTGQDTIPAEIPYLSAEPDLAEAWRRRVTGEGLKAGLVWRGNPQHSRDKRRSIAAGTIAGLLRAPGVRWFSLQAGEIGEEERTAIFSAGVIDCGPMLTDWAETAAAISALDLVVTVDTAVAHLAGALGKPVWILISAVADWRWLEGRTDSPWYPSARLFRQTAASDWDGVMEAVRGELARALRSGSGHSPG